MLITASAHAMDTKFDHVPGVLRREANTERSPIRRRRLGAIPHQEFIYKRKSFSSSTVNMGLGMVLFIRLGN